MAKAVLFDLDRTLIDLQSYTDYGAALADVEALIGAWDDVATPATDWDQPTIRCMSILFALSGDRHWQEVSDLIATHELAAVPSSRPMPRLADALARSRHLLTAVVTLVAEIPARTVLSRHGVDIPVVVPRRPHLRPKPAADQVQEACRLLGVVPAEAVMIGDSTWDAGAASAAGCGFLGVAATPGGRDRFDPRLPIAEDLIAALEMIDAGS